MTKLHRPTKLHRTPSKDGQNSRNHTKILSREVPTLSVPVAPTGPFGAVTLCQRAAGREVMPVSRPAAASRSNPRFPLFFMADHPSAHVRAEEEELPRGCTGRAGPQRLFRL